MCLNFRGVEQPFQHGGLVRDLARQEHGAVAHMPASQHQRRQQVGGKIVMQADHGRRLGVAHLVRGPHHHAIRTAQDPYRAIGGQRARQASNPCAGPVHIDQVPHLRGSVAFLQRQSHRAQRDIRQHRHDAIPCAHVQFRRTLVRLDHCFPLPHRQIHDSGNRITKSPLGKEPERGFISIQLPCGCLMSMDRWNSNDLSALQLRCGSTARTPAGSGPDGPDRSRRA